MISFIFAVRDIPLRFISSNLFFSAPIDRIDRIFVQALQRIQDLSCSKFLVAEKFSFQRVRIEKINYRIF